MNTVCQTLTLLHMQMTLFCWLLLGELEGAVEQDREDLLKLGLKLNINKSKCIIFQ